MKLVPESSRAAAVVGNRDECRKIGEVNVLECIVPRPVGVAFASSRGHTVREDKMLQSGEDRRKASPATDGHYTKTVDHVVVANICESEGSLRSESKSASANAKTLL